MTAHSMSSAAPASVPAVELLKANASQIKPTPGTLAAGIHQLGLLGTLLVLFRAGHWHAVWCLLGDVVDDVCDRVIAWFAIAAAVTVVLALGVTLGYAGGPVAALAYVLALIVAVLVWFRWDGGTR